MKIVKIFFLLLAIFLTVLVYNSLLAPIKFNKEKIIRYRAAVEKLIKIRDAQLAHKNVTGDFSSTFDSLYAFIDTAQFALVERRDTSYMKYDASYRIDKLVEETIIDTLSFSSVKDSLFKGYDYRQLDKVPFTKTATFEMKKGKIEKNAIMNPAFIAQVDKKVLLNGMDNQLISEEIGNYKVKGPTLKVGSLEKVTTGGNWPKHYEPSEESDK